MKKIINGKLYDTDTARLIGRWSNNVLSFDCIEESLYRKKTGEFFIRGYGGANTRYVTATADNHWSSGERIIPQTYEDAQQWAEEHLTADEYEAAFGKVEETGEKTVIALSWSAATVEKVKRAAAQHGVSISSYVEDLVLSSADFSRN